MVMAINNAALLTQPTDISNLSSSFRDGQKLRQEYESRQQQKALNDIMRISGEEELDTIAQQLAAARQHKYAGALVPAIQDYHNKQREARLENLKKGADIDKTKAEAEKIGAESGKIGAETEDTQLKTAQGIKDYVSAAAVTQDPKVFGLHIGELYKRGLITESQTQGLLSLIVKDPENAAKVMQSMAMGNPEIAKTFMPEFKTVDGGDKIYGFNVNQFTGEPSNPNMTIKKAATPDAVLRGEVDTNNNIRSTQASMYASDNSLKGTMYSSDNSLQGTMYTVDSSAETKMFEINQKGEIDWYEAGTNRIKAVNGGGKGGVNGGLGPKPAGHLKLENEYKEKLVSNAATMKQVANWTQKIRNGKLKLGAGANIANSVANRTGIKSLGSNPAAYAEFDSFIKDLATKALRLNVGVQTDADYKRQLEAMIAGDYIPRDKDTALGLLKKIQDDFVAANKGIYANYANTKAQYGENLPAYGTGAKKTAQPAKQTAKPANNTGSKGNNAKITAIYNKHFN